MTFRSDFDRAHTDLRLSFEMAAKKHQEEIEGLELELTKRKAENQNLFGDIQKIHTDRLEFAKAADTAEQDFVAVMDKISKVPDWLLKLCGANIDSSFYRRAYDIKKRKASQTIF